MSGFWTGLRVGRLPQTLALGFASALAGLIAIESASAQEMQPPRYTDTATSSCVYSFGATSCVQQYRYGDSGSNGFQAVRAPSESDMAEAREREQQWVSRCRPQVRHDAFGVGRYVYAAPGCEYGQHQD